MFASAERSVPLSFDAARLGLERAIADGGLVEQSRRADEAGARFVMPVGPHESITRDVVVLVAPPVVRGSTVAVPIRWEVPGPSGRFFPALDAQVLLDRDDDHRSTLRIMARYEPPLGLLGKVADRVLMARVANATMTEFLHELDQKIRQSHGEVRGPGDAER